MTQIFVSHSSNGAECAEQIRQGLEAKGFSLWREPTSLSMESILYPRTIENVILGSAALLLVWSSSSASSEWVERHILFAQRLKKMIVPVVIDGCAGYVGHLFTKSEGLRQYNLSRLPHRLQKRYTCQDN